jgi:hypothetical protein
MEDSEPDEYLSDCIQIEELSPDAIIPDSVNVMHDPEVEMPPDGSDKSPVEEELEKSFTNIKLEKMHDWSLSEGSDDSFSEITESHSSKKRKLTPTSGEEEKKRKKRIASPMTSSPLRKVDHGENR